MNGKQLGLTMIGMAALICTIPGLYVGAYLMVICKSFYVFPIPAVCMVGIAALAFNRAELV